MHNDLIFYLLTEQLMAVESLLVIDCLLHCAHVSCFAAKRGISPGSDKH